MGKYRNELEIVADVLSVVAEMARKTEIMYKANLSHELLKRYLYLLEKAELVMFEKPNYKLTKKGREFTDLFKKHTRRRKRLEKRLISLEEERKMLERFYRDQ